ncbi:MAG: hypothetical protein WCW54_00815 [Candidatus Paceibacterota bacterium]
MKFTKIFLFTLLAIFSLSFITSTTNVAQAGTGSGSVTVTVTPPPVVTPPTASLTADSYSLPYGGSTILHISGTNASYCILSWPGGSNTQGLKWNYTTPALTTTTTYKLACGNTKADEAFDSQIITVAPKTKTYTVSTVASPLNGGTISPTSAIVDESKTTSFTILPNAGYTLASVTGTGTGCNLVASSGNNQYTTGSVYSDCTVTANFVIVSVTANPLTYTVNPGTTVKFAYTATTNSGRGTECRLLDNVQAPLTGYQASGPIPFYITYPVGSYGFYVQCRDTKTITATANSAKITVNVIKDPICPNPNGCPWGTDLCPNTPGTQTTLPCPPPVCANGAVNPTLCTIDANNECLNGNTNPPDCTIPPVCANGAVNYSLCTIDNNNKCLNGYINPPACTIPPAGMSGFLNASDCTIQIGQSSCNANFSWKVTNPEKPGQSAVTIPVNKTVGTGDTGNNSITLPYNNSTTLYLYNNAKKLDQKNVKSVIDTTTSWWNSNGGSNGTGIVEALPQQGNQNNNGNNPVPPLPLPIITSFNIMSNGVSALAPKTIRYNTRVNIDWTSTDAVSCACTSADKKGVAGATCGDTVNNNPGSFQTLALKKSMVFTLSCINGNGVSTSNSKTVTVDDINTIYKEN